MNKNLVIGGVIVVALIAGGIFVVKSMKSKTSASQDTMMQAQPTASAPADIMTTAPETPGSSVRGDETTVKTFTVAGGNFYFKPNEMKVKKGDTVKITVTNDGGIHDFAIDEFNVHSKGLKSGESTDIEFTADKVGTFEFYCSVGKHRQMGMKGNLIVE